MSGQNQSTNRSLNPRTLRLLHKYLDDFVEVGKAKRGELAPVELEKLLHKAAVEEEEIRQIVSEYKRFHMR
jgi:hypothetical protein